MKRSLAGLIMVLLIFPVLLTANKQLTQLLKKKHFDQIAALTGDSSHHQLKAYFQEHKGLAFQLQAAEQLMYFVKFPERAEIGLITYKLKESKYSEFLLKPLLNPLYYVEKFRKYTIKDKTIAIGDAILQLKKGSLLKVIPFDHLYLFQGTGEFRIKPNDDEEKRTLKYLFKKETFSKTNKSAVIYLPNDTWIKKIQMSGELQKIKNKNSRRTLEAFQSEFGIWIKPFHEKWYLPFADSLNLVLFKRSRRSHYKYIYNQNLSPDTMLISMPKNQYILGYNSIKGPKFAFGSSDSIDTLKLNLFLNPKEQFLSGTSQITFSDPSDLKQIQLEKGLAIRGFRDTENKKTNFLKANEKYYVLGERIKNISLYYSGQVATDRNEAKSLEVAVYGIPDRRTDNFYIIGKNKRFYPRSGNQFFKASLTITLPDPYQCLATGKIVQFNKIGKRNLFKFETNGTRNLSLVYGNFRKLSELRTDIPIHIYGSEDLSLSFYFKLSEMEAYFNFLVHLYGGLDIPQLNILMRRWPTFGGISHNGLIIFNLAHLPASKVWLEFSTRNIFMDVPVTLTADLNRDNLIHELAHQWWGNLVSWSSFRDVWMLEGGAHLSTLLYLESILTEKEFLNLIDKKIKHWVFKRHDAGPIIYGQRISNITRDRSAFQSIVYNKSVLVFLMFRELIGKAEFSRRIQDFFTSFRFKTVSTNRFIRYMSNGDERLTKFFRKWVYSRQLPKVEVNIKINGKKAQLLFTQKDTDFVFPLRLEIRTGSKTVFKNVVIERQRQEIDISLDNSIRSVDILTDFSPVKISKS